MIKRLLIIILFLPLLSFAQFEMGVKLGGNIPIKYKENATYRRFGSELELNFHHGLKNNWGIEYGLMIDAHGALDKKHPDFEDTEYLRLQFYIPILVSYRFNQTPLNVIAGLMPVYKNALTFTYYAGVDPSDSNDNYATYPVARGLGCDIAFEVNYMLGKRFGTYFAYRTPIINTNSKYGLMSLGIHYKFLSK